MAVTVMECNPPSYRSGFQEQTYKGPSTCSTIDANGMSLIEIPISVMGKGENTSNL